MNPQPHLLPSNATPFEIAAASASDPLQRLQGALPDAVALKFRRPLQDGFIDHVMAEWGLDEMLAWVNEPELLLEHGIDILRTRGSIQAVRDLINLVGYFTAVEEAPVRRRRWNTFQLALGSVRYRESPDLDRLQGASQFAVAERSKMVRGFAGYDVRALELSWKRTSASRLSSDSGARVATNPAKWSFGRATTFEKLLGEADLSILGVWIAPSTGPFTWAGAPFPWSMANFPWGTPVNDVRRRIMVALLEAMDCWIEFKRGDGSVIGYRKARAVHAVAPDSNGQLQVGGQRYTLAPTSGELLYVEALTDFGNANGEHAVTVSLRFRAHPADTSKPGKLWCGAGDLSLPVTAVADQPVSIQFGATVRERVSTLLRFT